MSTRKITTLDGSSFLIAEDSGDFQDAHDDVMGFFYKDTRHLSKWQLRINGAAPQVLSCDDVEYYFSQHFLAPRTGTIYENPYLSIARRRLLGDGFVECVELMNHSDRAVQVRLEYEFEADFADLFEVKDQLNKKGKSYQKSEDASIWILGYARGDFKRETRIRCDFPCTFSPGKIESTILLNPKESKIVETQVAPVIGEEASEPKYAGNASARRPQPNLRVEFGEWMLERPQVLCNIPSVERLYFRSLMDLAALRFFPAPDELPDHAVPSAGLPWFMALFGRDSLITSYQALPFVPDLARTTLLTLAHLQGTKVDPFRDEEPGKILHELRFGELTHFEERPQSPYFGSSDSTPLFLILLDEYERWTGDRELVKQLQPHARRALEWIDRYGDRDGDGYVEYQRAMETGLENQCWKDSWNSILFSNGDLAQAPRALCEIQGYVYDAKVRTARLAREIWGDPELAQNLAEQAEGLKFRFNRDFWIESKQHYALALDRDKRQVDSLTSNVGHLLWSGIVTEERAPILAQHLMGDRLYSGWGVRTMASGESGYNPIEYHNGTVWPHDNSLIAAGLARYGFRAEAASICLNLVEASIFFNFRLPEVFAGYSRTDTQFPVQYPTASSPQAWATGSAFLALRVFLGLEVVDGRLVSVPGLPEEIGFLKVTGFRGPWGTTDIEAGQGNLGVKRDAITRKWFEARIASLGKKMAG